ncbi:MAG: hypothetical protein P4M13_09260 [Alphaproteobacteria bacterium]|nr:hypothetical protein [Alphaproteobacteria bacterium]
MTSHEIDWFNVLEETMKWRKFYEGSRIVVKFGGALAEAPKVVLNIAKQVICLKEFIRLSVVVVHSGGKQVDAKLEALGKEIKRDQKTGLRITDQNTLEATDDSLGCLNRDIVETFRNVGHDIIPVGAAGYKQNIVATSCGRDLGGFTGHLPVVSEGSCLDDWSADDFASYIPIIYPICQNRDSNGQENRLNVNADDVAAAIAEHLKVKRFILCSDIPGVLDAEGK